MKIYISVDMEGLAGIVHPRQEHDDSLRFRENMNEQVKWVIEAILNSNCNEIIEEITISDSHGKGMNLDYELTSLDRRINLISGTPRPMYMMEGVNRNHDIAFLIGYHPGVGESKANMDHSYGGKTFHRIEINNISMTEATINSAYAGYHDVPVGLVMGDSALKKQLIDDGLMPWINYIQTKESISYMSAKSKSKIILKEEIYKIVNKTLEEDLTKFKVYKFEKPYKLEIEFHTRSFFDYAMLIPGTKAIDGRTIQAEFTDYEVLFKAIMAYTYISSLGYPYDKR